MDKIWYESCFSKSYQVIVSSEYLHERRTIVMKQKLKKVQILYVLWASLGVLTLVSCQKRLGSKDNMVLGQGSPSCDIPQMIHQLTNPSNQNISNEKAFYQLAEQEGIRTKTGDMSRVRPSINVWYQKISAMACQNATKSRCRLALISKKISLGLVNLKYAKYSSTLKVKHVGGAASPMIFVKGTGLKPERDPLQPDGVKERYENRYHWFFREHAGDLHPGFIWGALIGELPEHLDPFCLESTHLCKDKDYKNVLQLWNQLLKKGYLTMIDRGEDIQDLYVVDPLKIHKFKLDRELSVLSAKLFGAAAGSALIESIERLMTKRAAPVFKVNSHEKYEITEVSMKRLGIDMPIVSLDGWTVYFVDHHRISAAHDLGMAIQVGTIHGFISFN